MNRRDFFKGLAISAFTASVGSNLIEKADAFTVKTYPITTKFPEKDKLILYSERPPLLETPRQYFDRAITPNKLFFVRWHLADIPTYVDLNSWRLKIQGNVKNPIEFSLDDLKTKFEPVSFYAVLQCSGNGRNFFKPKPKGIHWNHGAMGNALWTGVRLKDILNYAGIKSGSIEVAFDGLDKPPYPKTPDFIRSLPLDRVLEEDVILAYEMNNEPLPYLNGFPLRLIVPGWYATHWIKSVSRITVLDKPLKNFWMEKAYKLPDNDCECIKPGEKPEKTKTITTMNVKSVIAKPLDNSIVKVGEVIKIAGVAFDYGSGIRDVLLSFDNGKTWEKANLGTYLGRYSFREWFFYYKPKKKGKLTIMSRAINNDGQMQPFEIGWNPGGYKWNVVDKVQINIV